LRGTAQNGSPKNTNSFEVFSCNMPARVRTTFSFP
jgi:hypothetical protein